MKVTLQLQLLPAAEAAAKLEATVRRFNEAADWLAGEAFALKSGNKIALQKTHYAPLRERFGSVVNLKPSRLAKRVSGAT